MGWIAALIGNMLLSIAGSVAGSMLAGAGMAVVTYAGVDVALDFLKTQFVQSATSLPPEIVGMMALLKIGSCVSMMISAVVVKMGINGMTSGTVKQWAKK